jgi:hypothetical protein
MSSTPEAAVLDAFEALKPTLLTLKPESLRGLRMPAEVATGRGLALARQVTTDRTRFEDLYKNPPLALFDSLERRALAVKGAALTDEFAPVVEVSEEELKQAMYLRRKHLSILSTVFFDKEDVLKELSEIRTGRGHRDLGGDLVDLAALLSRKEIWGVVKPTTLVKDSTVNELEVLGLKILRWLDGDNSENNGRRFERLAWNYLMEAVDKVMVLSRPLYESQEEWEAAYPAFGRVVSTHRPNTPDTPSKN